MDTPTVVDVNDLRDIRELMAMGWPRDRIMRFGRFSPRTFARRVSELRRLEAAKRDYPRHAERARA